MQTLNVSLPEDMIELVHAKVEAGAFASSSDVVREALRIWQSDEARHQDRLVVVRKKIAEADADPSPSLTEEEMDEYFAILFEGHQ
jgi:antitoxin ParD1/3/4